jgi:DNA primase
MPLPPGPSRPNLHVSRASERWISYRCDEHGDAIRFVQLIEKLTFRDAAARLGAPSSPQPRALSARVKAPARPTPKRLHTLRSGEDLDVMEAASELYANHLLSNEEAVAYMVGRGFPLEVLRRCRVGYATGGELIPYVRWRRLPIRAALRTGLVTANRGEYLAGRIVFSELRNNRAMWMIGRLLENAHTAPLEEPRYLGLPGSKPLLGWDEAVRDPRGVCLVEGPTDLLALRMWGVPGLALTGTGISVEKPAQLEHFDRVYMVLDQDDGGKKATTRLVTTLGARAIPVRLPEGINDRVELARLKHGAELFAVAIRNATMSSEPGRWDRDERLPLQAAA